MKLELLSVGAVALAAGCGADAHHPVVVAAVVGAQPGLSYGGAVRDEVEARPESFWDADLTPHLRGKLSSGVVVNLVVDVEIEDGHASARRLEVGSCTVRFDLEDEVYRFGVPAGGPERFASPSFAGVMARCVDRKAYGIALAKGRLLRRIIHAREP